MSRSCINCVNFMTPYGGVPYCAMPEKIMYESHNDIIVGNPNVSQAETCQEYQKS